VAGALGTPEPAVAGITGPHLFSGVDLLEGWRWGRLRAPRREAGIVVLAHAREGVCGSTASSCRNRRGCGCGGTYGAECAVFVYIAWQLLVFEYDVVGRWGFVCCGGLVE
jgi:hypothetical protein